MDLDGVSHDAGGAGGIEPVRFPGPYRGYHQVDAVDDDGVECPGADFSHPQDAVNAANPGDTIMVYPGTYGSRRYTSPTPPHWSAPNDQYAPALIVYKNGLTIEAVDPDPSKTIIESTHDWWSNPYSRLRYAL